MPIFAGRISIWWSKFLQCIGLWMSPWEWTQQPSNPSPWLLPGRDKLLCLIGVGIACYDNPLHRHMNWLHIRLISSGWHTSLYSRRKCPGSQVVRESRFSKVCIRKCKYLLRSAIFAFVQHISIIWSVYNSSRILLRDARHPESPWGYSIFFLSDLSKEEGRTPDSSFHWSTSLPFIINWQWLQIFSLIVI